jgi:hypothetical protein
VVAESAFFPLLGESEPVPDPQIRLIREPLASSPDPQAFTSSPLGQFANIADGIAVRSLANLPGLISANGREIRYFNDFSPALAEITAVVDEFSALAMDIRGEFCLHAALIVSPAGRGVVLLGDTGVGKSTAALITALEPQWKVGCDDAVVLKEADGGVIALPSYPGIKVSRRSLDLLQSSAWAAGWDDLLSAKTVEKRRILPGTSSAARDYFHVGPVPVDAIVDLRPSPDSVGVQLEPLNSGEIVRRLLWSVFSVPVLGKSEEIRRFEQAVAIVKSVVSCAAVYPKQPQSIRTLLGRLQMDHDSVPSPVRV